MTELSNEAKDDILLYVSEFSGVPVDALLSKTRHSANASAWRSLAYLILRESGCTYQRIGDYFAGRGSSTILLGCNRARAMVSNDESSKVAWDNLLNKAKQIMNHNNKQERTTGNA